MQPLQALTLQNDRGTSWDQQYEPASLSNLPASVDLRSKFEDAGIEVYDQTRLNSCTANAICAAWRYAQAQVDPGFTPSRLFLYYNERLVEGTTSQDHGARISTGCKSLASYGLCSEDNWSYDEENEAVKPPQEAYDEGLQHIIHTPAQISNNDPDNLKASLADGKPFVVGIVLYKEFTKEPTRSDGNVTMPTSSSVKDGRHAVLCVGYDDDREVWIFRNSWGPQWGDQGHFYLPYEYLKVEDHLSSDFWNLATDSQEGSGGNDGAGDGSYGDAFTV